MTDTRFDPDKVDRVGVEANFTDDDGLRRFWDYDVVRASDYDQLLALYRQREWISVSERLPIERELVLACLEDGTRLISSWFKWESMPEPLWHGFIRRTGDVEHRVTHWQPLPEPPAAVKEEM